MKIIYRLAAVLMLSVLSFGALAQDAQPVTAAVLSQAIADGTIDQVIVDALGEAPTEEQLTELQTALDSLAETAPTEAAAAAQSVINAAFAITGTSPQTAVDLVNIAVTTLTNPAVVAAAPEAVGRGLAAAQQTIDNAISTAADAGIALTGTYIMDSEAVARARENEAVMIAEADATLAGFNTAGGEVTEGQTPDGNPGTDTGTGGTLGGPTGISSETSAAAIAAAIENDTTASPTRLQ